MNNPTIARILSGTLVLAFGVLALLDAVNVINFWDFASTWWRLLFILAGVLIFVGNTRQYLTALAFIIIGSLLQLNALGVIEVDFWQVVWPVILIGVGVSILVNRPGAKQLQVQDTENISAIFGGSETINKSNDYQGGKISAVFGGVVVDLRDATIKKEATIEVFTLCGGIELKVPRNWQVRQQVFPILGGVESKSHSEKADTSGPILYINGTVALGGVEVHS